MNLGNLQMPLKVKNPSENEHLKLPSQDFGHVIDLIHEKTMLNKDFLPMVFIGFL